MEYDVTDEAMQRNADDNDVESVASVDDSEVPKGDNQADPPLHILKNSMPSNWIFQSFIVFMLWGPLVPKLKRLSFILSGKMD